MTGKNAYYSNSCNSDDSIRWFAPCLHMQRCKADHLSASTSGTDCEKDPMEQKKEHMQNTTTACMCNPLPDTESGLTGPQPSPCKNHRRTSSNCDKAAFDGLSKTSMSHTKEPVMFVEHRSALGYCRHQSIAHKRAHRHRHPCTLSH